MIPTTGSSHVPCPRWFLLRDSSPFSGPGHYYKGDNQSDNTTIQQDIVRAWGCSEDEEIVLFPAEDGRRQLGNE